MNRIGRRTIMCMLLSRRSRSSGICLGRERGRQLRRPYLASVTRAAIMASTSRAMLRRSSASRAKSVRFLISLARLAINSQSSASLRSFSSFALRSYISQPATTNTEVATIKTTNPVSADPRHILSNVSMTLTPNANVYGKIKNCDSLFVCSVPDISTE